MSRRRPARRSWRRRGRKGQVAAIATLFGLMIVVTFIANFLTTVVPSQMAVNDLNHIVTVEDQVGRLGALIASAGKTAIPGVQLVQPISLGSDGVPPWQAPDGASVGGAYPGSTINVSYGLQGLLGFNPPLGMPQGGPPLPAACAWTSPAHVGIACGGGAGNIIYNFAGNGKNFSVTSGGATTLFAFNFSTNNSHIALSGTGGPSMDIHLYGSNNVLTLSENGASSINVTVVGSHNLINLGGTGGAAVVLRIYGSSDTVYQSGTGGASVLLLVFGSQDSFVGNATGAATYTAYVNGFNASSPNSPLCPYDNLSGTNTLGGSHSGGSNFTAYYNDTSYWGNQSGSWTGHNQVPGLFPCPFFSRQAVPIVTPLLTGAGFVVHLFNSYAPSGEVALDEGAVIYAQSGGFPVMVDLPQFHVTGTVGHVTALDLWFPYFVSSVGSSRGIGTETLALRLLGSNSLAVTSSGQNLQINPNVSVRITITTPYAEAWDGYLSDRPIFTGMWSCAPVAVCTGTYTPGNPLGTVSIVIPATFLAALKVGTASFAAGLS